LYQKGPLNREFRSGESIGVSTFQVLHVPTAKTFAFPKMDMGWMQVIVGEQEKTISPHLLARDADIG
jgi:hypothetical protein